MNRLLACLWAAAVLLGAAGAIAEDEPSRRAPTLLDGRSERPVLSETRKVLALVDQREETVIRLTRIHSMAEMPLNHLGLDVVYWNVGDGLPDLRRWPDVRGIITWFANDPFERPREYVNWLMAAMDRGVKVAMLGQTGMRASKSGELAPIALANRFFAHFGMRDDDGYSDLNHNARPSIIDGLIGFERSLKGTLSGYPLLRQVDARAVTHLALRRNNSPETESHLVVTGPAGGYAIQGFVRYYDTEFNRNSWIINPFEFFRLTFATDDLPKPDVTTLSGRRIYFSHIDGDGWRNLTEAQPYAKQKLLSSAVVRLALIEPYPDLPVSVAPIVGDLDPTMAGSETAADEARRVFALPQVEASSHTWSHPFFWEYFRDYKREDESRFHGAGAEAGGGKNGLASWLGRKNAQQVDGAGAEGGEEAGGIGRYKVPRAFLQTPFNLDEETGGSLEYMNRFKPADKPAARLYQWSGDTSPWEDAVAAVRKAGGVNMNGGDTRFDAEYPSYTSVSAIGRPAGKERQIYAAASNENTYTELWTNKFFGFQNLVHTLEATETPLRVKPFNIYYHSYSGQKTASLNAVRKNLEYARKSEIAPIAASHYVDIANGFYTTRFVDLGERRWRILDRGALQTIRFDRASFTAVDFRRSHGVLGQRHYQGSLYVALDPAVAEPVAALTETDRADVPPDAPRPYLIQSRWEFSDLRLNGQGFSVTAQGYGVGEMEWHVPWPGRYDVVARRDGAEAWRGVASATQQGKTLKIAVPADGLRPLRIIVTPKVEGG